MKWIVEEGYDRIAGRFADWSAAIVSPERERITALLLASLPSGALVLELGCGNGMPVTARLAERFDLTGVDISTEQLARARRAAPAARFIQGDMASMEFQPASFAAVVALYSIIHLPCEEHGATLGRMARWLRPGGLMVINSAASAAYRGYEADWLGAPMVWSHHDPETMRRLTLDAGLEILSQRIETINEGTGVASFVWWVARKPEGTATS
jgi:ubiquinone/menaquinone biosynthesis C-methylase UbiE